MLEALGNFVYRHRWATLVGSAVILAFCLALVLRGGRLTTGTIPGLEATRAQEVADALSGRAAETTFVAVFRAGDEGVDAGRFREALTEVFSGLREHADVLAVTAPGDLPHLLGPTMIDAEAGVAFAWVSLRGDLAQALESYPRVRQELRSPRLRVDCTGQVPFLHDLNKILARDLLVSELVALPLALLILLTVFGSLAAAVLPVLVGGLAVLAGTAVVLELARHMEMAEYAINVCSLIGLGVGIDYSLFMVSRYREALAEGLDHKKALLRAMNTAGRVVAFSGFAVGAGLSGLLFFRGSYLEGMGIGGAIVVAFAVLCALTVLPALLAVLGPRIEAGAVPWRRRKGTLGESFWHRAAEWVMRRPLRVLVATLSLLLLMAAPFLRLRTASADIQVLPPETEARRAYEVLGRFFPEQTKTPILLAVEFPSGPALTPDRIRALHDLSRRARALPDVTRVESIVDGPMPLSGEEYVSLLLSPPAAQAAAVEMSKQARVGQRATVLHVLTPRSAESEEARAIVRALRADPLVADGTVFVGGRTAQDLDTTTYVAERTPRVVAFVIAVMCIVLFFFLKSVILPLKAVAMNFVSIAAALGALVWVFQEGRLFVGTGRPLEPSLPVLLFCVLFGLSMDYEVLMLSRIREAWLRTGDNGKAVAEGLSKSAGLITSAAAIMVAVFSAFTLGHVDIIRAVGFGMAFAVFLDATLVRVLLVPSTMRLLGRANWWAPRIFQRRRRLEETPS